MAGADSLEALTKGLVERYSARDRAGVAALWLSDEAFNQAHKCKTQAELEKTRRRREQFAKQLDKVAEDAATMEWVGQDELEKQRKDVAKGTEKKGCTTLEAIANRSLKVRVKLTKGGKSKDGVMPVRALGIGGRWYLIEAKVPRGPKK